MCFAFILIHLSLGRSCLINECKKIAVVSDCITHEEGLALSVPCTSPHTVQNFTLTWTFTSFGDPTVILRYDSKTRHLLNQWEGQTELDQQALQLGDGSLLLHRPDIEKHSGTYTCTFSGVQSRHVIQTQVNVTASSMSEYAGQKNMKHENDRSLNKPPHDRFG